MTVKVTAELIIYAENDAAAGVALAAFLVPVKGATAHVIETSRESYDGRPHT